MSTSFDSALAVLTERTGGPPQRTDAQGAWWTCDRAEASFRLSETEDGRLSIVVWHGRGGEAFPIAGAGADDLPAAVALRRATALLRSHGIFLEAP